MRQNLNLCGLWEMVYSTNCPSAEDTAPNFTNSLTVNAVPGYWEDMMPALQMAPYWDQVEFNPEYKPLRYPMTGTVPDMVLETIVGCFWYRRTEIMDVQAGERVLFHCGGVQNRALLWVNGVFAGEHCGYCTPFDFDITSFIRTGEENEFLFAVSNHQAYNEVGEPISGCTSRAANRYTGGITGEICLHITAADAIDDAFVSSYDAETDSVTVYTTLSGEGNHILRWQIEENGSVLACGESAETAFTVSRGNLAFWSPKSPKLYILRLTLLTEGVVTDVTEQTIGIRALRAVGNKLEFNGQPIFLRGICEHGYFARSVHPEMNIDYYLNSIRVDKRLDFNFIRFHTWVPTEEYMTAADQLGMLLHIESPNNTTEAEWADIMRFVRRHPSVVIACCGNELLIDEYFLGHLERCADITHTLAPNILFSPLNALRGLEYHFVEEDQKDELLLTPLRHHPRRFATLQKCCDLFSSYSLGELSYNSFTGSPARVDSWADVYKIPRITHEICIQGTYADLGLEWRYEGTRIGESEAYSSIRKILREAGLLHRAPLYYNNSCRWQMLLRKQCFENTRLCRTLSGYDYLGDIDHHWHTFGYRAGMMNEFYELKPYESEQNVRRYNGESVLLCDLGNNHCFTAGKTVPITFLASLYGGDDLTDGRLDVIISRLDHTVLDRYSYTVSAPNGAVSELTKLELPTPAFEKPTALRISVRLSGGVYEIENEWDIWLYPEISEAEGDTIVTMTLDDEILAKLTDGADVLLLGPGPFAVNPVSYRISLAGRTAGNLATVIENHPLSDTYEHEGYCGWQFAGLMTDATCLYYQPGNTVPFDPIIEVVSSYKWIRPQAALVEWRVGKGRLLHSTFNVTKDVAGPWWKNNLLRYMHSDTFSPRNTVTVEDLKSLYAHGHRIASENNNYARNTNDRTMKR